MLRPSELRAAEKFRRLVGIPPKGVGSCFGVLDARELRPSPPVVDQHNTGEDEPVAHLVLRYDEATGEPILELEED